MQQLIYYRLSASSILVAKGGVCKLSGFGFQKEITERNIYEKVINVLYERFNTQTIIRESGLIFLLIWIIR